MKTTTWLYITIGVLLVVILAGLIYYPQEIETERVVIVTQTETVEVPVNVTTVVYKYIENTRCNCNKEPTQAEIEWAEKVEDKGLDLYHNKPSACALAHNRSAC